MCARGGQNSLVSRRIQATARIMLQDKELGDRNDDQHRRRIEFTRSQEMDCTSGDGKGGLSLPGG